MINVTLESWELMKFLHGLPGRMFAQVLRVEEAYKKEDWESIVKIENLERLVERQGFYTKTDFEKINDVIDYYEAREPSTRNDIILEFLYLDPEAACELIEKYFGEAFFEHREFVFGGR